MVMSTPENYRAILKVQRWRDTPLLGTADQNALANDMEFVYQALVNLRDTAIKLGAKNLEPKHCRPAPKEELPKEAAPQLPPPVETAPLRWSL